MTAATPSISDLPWFTGVVTAVAVLMGLVGG